MRAAVLLIALIIAAMDTFSQNQGTDRQPVAAGRFYAAGKTELTKDISGLFRDCIKTSLPGRVRALVSPHAGYIFSGKTAAAALSTVPRDVKFSNIFIIGSSHVMSFEGASVYYTGDFLTPLGKASVNRDIANRLVADNRVFSFPVTAHEKEHSIEVQVPLLQYYFNDMPQIVPIIIGTSDKNIVRKIASALQPWFTEENLFIISSDFSHYPSYTDAVSADRASARALISGDPDIFLDALENNERKDYKGLATSMCGWTSGLMLLYLTEGKRNLEYRLVDYSNSGDSPYGSKSEVVGYNAIAVFEKNGAGPGKTAGEEMAFTDEERAMLFSIARSAIETRLAGKAEKQVSAGSVPSKLMEPYGAFVTLRIKGVLRGCIGRFISSEPLYKVVRESALSSAFGDPRFLPLDSNEYPDTDIEITVLGPLRKVSDISEIILGKHGIFIKKDSRSGTMLPQVATENGWTVEEFLGYTSRDKAGIGWDGWKTADIYVYDGAILEEGKR